MNLTLQYKPTSYAEADSVLAAGNGQVRKIANNTYLERMPYGNKSIVVRFHATAIVTFYYDNTTVLNSGGHRTKTTFERLNRYLPQGAEIVVEDGLWIYRATPSSFSDAVKFEDEMIIDSTTGEVID